MKVLSPLVLAGLVAATPAHSIERRQVAQELTKGSCKAVTMIWVRGTGEAANLGRIIGGQLVPAVKKKLPDIAVEGVTYSAGVAGNLTPEGGDASGIAEAKRLYNLAASKCPQTIIIGGGYSQGAAITHRAVEALPEATKARIAGIVLYGDTKHAQDKGMIKNFPKDKVRTFCNGYDDLKDKPTDGVCGGMLAVNGGHMSYTGTFGTAADWLYEKVTAFKG